MIGVTSTILHLHLHSPVAQVLYQLEKEKEKGEITGVTLIS